MAALRAVCDFTKVACSFDEDGVDRDKNLVDLSKGEVRSDNGQLFRSRKKRYGTIVSSKTIY